MVNSGAAGKPGKSDRETVIATALQEFNGADAAFTQGIEPWAWVNGELSTKGMSSLSTGERDTLNKGSK